LLFNSALAFARLASSNWQQLPGYTAATAEAEDASERVATLALKRDVVSTHWAWGGDGFFMKRSRMMHTINDQLQPSNAQHFGI